MNNQPRLIAITSLAVICLVAVPYASAQHLTDQWVEQMAAQLIENKIADGLSIGYIEGNHYGTVHLGSSNESGKKANNLTLYEIGSISKVFTGILLADAVVRGEINLNDRARVSNQAGIHFRSYDGREIHWIDLSTHRSGLPRLPSNLLSSNPKNPYQKYDSKLAAAFLNDYRLPRQPGSSQEYSNFAVSVLGYLLAQNEGMTYEELLQDRIAKPLRMKDCAISLSADQNKRMATPHVEYGSATLPWTFADLPGAGGIRTTMFDMMRFAKAQLSPPSGPTGEAIELAWKQHHAADASGPAMGLGWVIHEDGQTRWHNGGTGGSRSAIFINRELKCAVIVLCNTAVSHEVDQLAMQIIAKAAGQEVKSTSIAKGTKGKEPVIDADHRARLVGLYELSPDFIMTIADDEGTLTVTATGQATLELIPDSPTEWSNAAVKATLEFKLPRKGPARSLTLHQNGARQIARRIKEDKDAEDIEIDAKLRRRLVGRYQLTPDFIFTVSDADGHLMVGITNQATQEVFPESATHWTYRGVDATLEFKLRKSGRAQSLILHQNGIQQMARRIK